MNPKINPKDMLEFIASKYPESWKKLCGEFLSGMLMAEAKKENAVEKAYEFVIRNLDKRQETIRTDDEIDIIK